ncbi:hypothetical protein FB451DRAFT_1482687 [Mycena latifolia]|nr:hypothetical protein FB451DRAFT_1482687 [Mycena latifolia]
MAPVTLNIGHYESLYFTHVILDNSARIHALKLQGQAMGIHDLLSKLPEHDFSILSALDLDPSSNRDELPDDFVKVLPDEMFDGRMPKLRELVVKDVDLPCKLLSGLQMLSLTHCNDSATSLPPTFDLLLEMLGSCPQLRTLLLDLVIYGPLPHQQYASVHLPTLNWLTIRNDAHICTALLNHISFPPTTSIHIEPSGVHVGGDIRNMLVPICKHMRAPAAPKPPLLQIECTRSVTTAPNFSIFTTILYRDTTPPTVCDREDPSCPLMIDACPIGEAALRQIISKVLKAIPFESITHLYARRRAHFTVAAWKTAMKLLPALQTVYLAANNDAITFIRVLIQLELLDAPRRRAFPHVRSLHIFAHREERDIRLMLLAVVEFENRNFSLSDQEEKLDQLFPLIGKLIWNNTVYDPATRKAEREAWEMERRAFALKFGIEIE